MHWTLYRWLSGECRFGDRCNFAHGEHELRALPPRGGGYAGGGGRGGGRVSYQNTEGSCMLPLYACEIKSDGCLACTDDGFR
eukprot:359869-Chlamydomonas_euryale.AAC.39